MNTTKRKTTSLRLSVPVREKLEEIAKKENRSLNNLVDTLLAQLLGLREPNQETKQYIEEAMEEKPHQKRYTDLNSLFEDLAK